MGRDAASFAPFLTTIHAKGGVTAFHDMPIYDFSDPAWTDARIATELATAYELPHGDERAARVGPLVLEQGRRRRKRNKEAQASNDEPKRTTRKTGRPRLKNEPRIKWRYFPFPTAIFDDPRLSTNAKLAAGAIARAVNLGPWNVDLHADLKSAAFGLGSPDTVERAIRKLRKAGYVKTESLNRGGVRYWFTERAYGKPE